MQVHIMNAVKIHAAEIVYYEILYMQLVIETLRFRVIVFLLQTTMMICQRSTCFQYIFQIFYIECLKCYEVKLLFRDAEQGRIQPFEKKGNPNSGQKGIPSICPHSNAFIGQKKGGSNPRNPPTGSATAKHSLLLQLFLNTEVRKRNNQN